MAKGFYTNRQLEVDNLLRSVSKGKGEGVPPEVVDHIMNMVGEAETEAQVPQKEDSEALIKMRLLDEKDWRKRAALSALLISKSLE